MAGPDWDVVEREYRLGQMTLAEIAASFGVSAGTVARRARAAGWTRGGGGEDALKLAALRGIEVVRMLQNARRYS